MATSYERRGLVLGAMDGDDPQLVRALQHDLRALGYLHDGIDGAFGLGTHAAVRALQFDLLRNDGRSTGGDGPAPVAIRDYNQFNGAAAVTIITGQVDEALAHC